MISENHTVTAGPVQHQMSFSVRLCVTHDGEMQTPQAPPADLQPLEDVDTTREMGKKMKDVKSRRLELFLRSWYESQNHGRKLRNWLEPVVTGVVKTAGLYF